MSSCTLYKFYNNNNFIDLKKPLAFPIRRRMSLGKWHFQEFEIVKEGEIETVPSHYFNQSDTMIAEARHLLQTLPELPLVPSLPLPTVPVSVPVPGVPIPEVPVPDVSTVVSEVESLLPNTQLPSVPLPEVPKVAELPPVVQKPELPAIPGVPIPELPIP
ncbi:hypothetical protein RIF29_41581 [Crotalaria pallida]|uniref:Uncharacterized protein n=1 Tax=Crotalaria pallida TaxID=3830 RepID=A0AAN9E5Z5_CROPI